MKLSPHFNLNEFTRSETGDRLGIENIPSDSELESLIRLCENVLEPIRAMFNAPITITSGYRSPALNRQIGGSSASSHCRGEAADFLVHGRTCREVALMIERSELDFDQLILEYPSETQPDGAWVHISYTPRNRRDVMTAIKINRNTTYKRILTTSLEKDLA